VTPGHWPRWLNWTHPRIRLVNQDDLIPRHVHQHHHAKRSLLEFPTETTLGVVGGEEVRGDEKKNEKEEEKLEQKLLQESEHWDKEDGADEEIHKHMKEYPPPTFNTNVIEQFLWRIPGLTDYFIHLNDDYFFGGLWDPEDFFTPEGGTRFYYTHNRIPVDRKRMQDIKNRRKIWLASLYNSMIAIGERYPESKSELYSLKHAPYVYHRDAWAWVHHIFRAPFQQSLLHPFRHYDDVLPPYLHHAFVTYQSSKWNDEGDPGVIPYGQDFEGGDRAMEQLMKRHYSEVLNNTNNVSKVKKGKIVGSLEEWTHSEMDYPLIHRKMTFGPPRRDNSWDDRGKEMGFCILSDDMNANARCLNPWRRTKEGEQRGSLLEFFLGSKGTPRFFVINDSFTKKDVSSPPLLLLLLLFFSVPF
jgi:hypothetical protein